MSLIDQMRKALLAADYTTDAVLDRITPVGQDGLTRNSTIPARCLLAGDDDAQATMIRLFPLHDELPSAQVNQVFDVPSMAEAGLVEVNDQAVRALVDLRPYAFPTPDGQWDGWVVCDHIPGLDHHPKTMPADHVLGLSPASSTLAQMSIPTPVGRTLDLGTGCGVQSLHLATHADRVVATDVNPRALWMAGLTAGLNRLTVDIRAGSLYQPVAGERFDLIVTNPPYVMSPPDSGERLVYREGDIEGDGLVRQIVTGAHRHLTEGGICQVLANWALTAATDWRERLAGWAPPGCDLWVIERERLDIYSYIEMWLSDAGLAGDPQWPIRYQEWLDYFARLGIDGVGMGWIMVLNPGRDDPEIRIESWPYEVAQPVGADLADFARRIEGSRLSEAEMLAATWIIRPDLVQETLGRPGAGDPQFVVLRQSSGLKRALEVATASGGVLGACDGTMNLGTITRAVAHLLDTDHEVLCAEVLPLVRQAVADGYLHRTAD